MGLCDEFFVFSRMGARVDALFTSNDGELINENCGALHPEILANEVVKRGADMGLCLDGDADRVIAADEKGDIVNGDKIIYILARALAADDRLPLSAVVGTLHTNMGVEAGLNRLGIELVRTDILEVFGPTLSDLKVNGRINKQTGRDVERSIESQRSSAMFRTVVHFPPAMVMKPSPFCQISWVREIRFVSTVPFYDRKHHTYATFTSRTSGRIPLQTARISSFVIGLSMNLLTSAKMSSMSSSVTSGWSSTLQGVSVVPTSVLDRRDKSKQTSSAREA